jgi:hypothetical protein
MPPASESGSCRSGQAYNSTNYRGSNGQAKPCGEAAEPSDQAATHSSTELGADGREQDRSDAGGVDLVLRGVIGR